MNIATIGYEKSSLEDFLETLSVAGIKTLIDVRQLPLSRRKGFSKRALAEALETVGIEYVHLKGLGDPKEGREAAKAGRYGDFLKIFSSHMKTPEFKSSIERAVSIIEKEAACLMCYERNPEKCHRKLVAEAILGIIGVKIKHLGVSIGVASNGSKNRTRENANPRESFTTGR